MDFKAALTKVKKIISQHFEDETVPPPGELTDGKLSDGTIIKYSALEAGGQVFVVGEDGTNQPAPAGDMELEDGTILVIAEGGVISEVKDAAPPAAEDMNKDNPEAAAQFAAIKAENAALQARVVKLESTNTAVGQVLASMREVIENLCAAEDGSPVTPPKQTVLRKHLNEKEESKKQAKESFLAAYKKVAERMQAQKK